MKRGVGRALDWLADACDRSFAAFMCVFMSGALVVVLLVVAVVIGVDKHLSRNECPKWGATRQVETRWVEYNLVSYDCVAKTPRGRWVSTDSWDDNIVQLEMDR